MLLLLQALATLALLGSLAVGRTVLEDANFWTRKGLQDLKNSLVRERIDGKAKNIIIFIGDGLGVTTHTMARIYKGQKKGETGEEQELLWETFPYTGLIKTYNTDYQVPDSAGTATAILTGVKTRMGMLGLDQRARFNVCDPDAVKAGTIDSVMDWAVERGKEVGVVTTARITHATPGAMYAHIPMRDWESDADIPAEHRKGCEDIASQLVKVVLSGKLKVAFGGGIERFRTADKKGKRNDSDLVDYMESKGVRVLKNTADLQQWDYADKTVGLFGTDHLQWEPQRDQSSTGQPSLEEMTRQAITRLSKNKEGFVLLVEGGRIDMAHHYNLARHAMEETLSMEAALAAALAMVNIKETLVIVTADHSHAVTMSGYPVRGNSILGTVYDSVTKYVMTDPNNNQSQPYQTVSYANGPGFKHHFDPETHFWRNLSLEKDLMDYNYTQPAMFHLDYETHGGEDVTVYARGPQAHLFSGVHEQNYIGVVMGYAGCLADQFGCPPAAERGGRAPSSAATTVGPSSVAAATTQTMLLLASLALTSRL